MTRSTIKSEKILVKDIFSTMWFRIPEYQRPYVWGSDQVHDLLDDLNFAMSHKSDSEYFLGSFVFQSKLANSTLGQDYDENDLLDGQQRMTTLLLLFAVLRDLASEQEAKDDCQKCIYQKASKYRKIPERTRLSFGIRDEVQTFVEKHIQQPDGTIDLKKLSLIARSTSDVSVKNMSSAVVVMHKYFSSETVDTSALLGFILNNVLLIYVSTENMEDAFRLFTILNDRGVPLRNSDILKSTNLGALDKGSDKIKYAKLWEEAEGELGENFDRFLNHLRSVLIKEKARQNLLKEFEDKIYSSKGRNRPDGPNQGPLLRKGKETFVFVEEYLKHYKTLLSGDNLSSIGNYAFDNLVSVMLSTLPATDWIPPLLHYYHKFGNENLLEFLHRLDVKFSADWIAKYTPTHRIEAMNEVTKCIDRSRTYLSVLNSSCFDFDQETFVRTIESDVYGRRFAKYLLLKLDYIFQSQDQRLNLARLSVEHILPRNPKADSQWCVDFSDGQRKEWTNKLGNLVMITRRKNSSLGRLGYSQKKDRYFQHNIDTCPNSLRVLNKYSQWNPTTCAENQLLVINELKMRYGIRS